MNINLFQVGDVLATRPDQSVVLKKEDEGLLLKMGDQHIWALGVDTEMDKDENWQIVWEKAYYFDDIAIVPDLKELTQYDNCSAVMSNSLWYVIDDRNCALLSTSSFFPDELPGDEVVLVPSSISFNNQRYEVTGVADWAFFNNKQITNMRLPDSIANIGKHAFTGASLKNITLPKHVFLGDNSFYGCEDLELNTFEKEDGGVSGEVFMNIDNLESWQQMFKVRQKELMNSEALFVSYNGFTEDVSNLKEGMKLADDLINSEGGDVNIRQGEEMIAYREWFAFDDLIDGMDNPTSAECNPIIFAGIGFYSDWVIDTDWEQDAQVDLSILENNLKKGDVVKTNASDSTIVLDVSGDNALLFTGTQFIEANNCHLDDTGLHWDFGNYYQNFTDIPKSEYRTFGEFLNSERDLDCELIIGDEEMDMSLVWGADDRITHYGYKQFQDLLDCSYEVLPNGNISIDDGNAEQGNLFVGAAAGYVSHSESLRLFTKTPEPEVDWDYEM